MKNNENGMTGYIEKENVLKRLRYLRKVFSEPPMDNKDMIKLKLAQFLYKELEEYPTADVVAVKHGENITKMHPVDEFICSECGLIMQDLSEVRIDEENEDECYYEFEFNYCPNCGAKMDGKVEEE